MIKLIEGELYLIDGSELTANKPGVSESRPEASPRGADDARTGTIAYGVLASHNTSGGMDNLKLRFDSLASHDITFVGVIQTARASGLEKFPLPYVLTCCHNSLCAVGGTINADDHMFGLSAAKKYGGVFVPPHFAVIHQYMREMMAGCGRMILGSDSHTRYGALGTLAIGEGGGELTKQLLERTYDIPRPEVVAVYLDGAPREGVGPQDVALQIVKAVFANGFVKNKIMEFVGPGVSSLNIEYRNGIDVMTTETACLSSIWRTDGAVREYLAAHGRAEDYRELNPAKLACYDGALWVDLGKIEPSIALPFHPSNVYTIRELNENPGDILRSAADGLERHAVNGKVAVRQAIVAGCAGGTFDNICAMADIFHERSLPGGAFSLSVYPSSQPAYLALVKNGIAATLMESGAVMKTAFCGPCFGAGDTPANDWLSVRHATRNFPNREGSKPGEGQFSYVALMDARSIAATAANGGVITAATDFDVTYSDHPYSFDRSVYEKRVFFGWGRANAGEGLVTGPNIRDWPRMSALNSDILLLVASVITDDVTTTDELIPSGETSSYRSNPIKLSEFTLARRDPGYVDRAKAARRMDAAREGGVIEGKLAEVCDEIRKINDCPACRNVAPASLGVGSLVYAVKPGDGSAREQAASAQRVLGGLANIAGEYATKRYRSNLINWGMIPFLIDGDPKSPPFAVGDYIFIPGIRDAVEKGQGELTAYVIGGTPGKIVLKLEPLLADEKKIIASGSLINYYKSR